MTQTNDLTCEITSDLMVLYTAGHTSPETNARVQAHLRSCEACAQAFGREPNAREHVPPGDIPRPEIEPEDFYERFLFFWLPVWAFMLYLVSRLLHLLDLLLRRFGKSTKTLKIRVYRARRRVAGKIVSSVVPGPETVVL